MSPQIALHDPVFRAYFWIVLVALAIAGAVLGFVAYATYDLTNLAVIRNWPLALSFIDIAWGTLVSGVAAAAGALALRWFAGR